MTSDERRADRFGRMYAGQATKSVADACNSPDAACRMQDWRRTQGPMLRRGGKSSGTKASSAYCSTEAVRAPQRYGTCIGEPLGKGSSLPNQQWRVRLLGRARRV